MEALIVSGQIPPAPLRFNHRASPVRRAQAVPFRRRIVAAANLTSQTQTHESVPKSTNRMFILGMGYVGPFVPAKLKLKGWEICGTCEGRRTKESLEEKGFEDIQMFNTNEPELSTLNAMKGCTHLLVGHPVVDGIGDPMLRHEELLRSALVDGNLKWLCYLSNTLVYGDHGGAWVDEDLPTNSETEFAKMILAAEEGWLRLGHDLGLSASVFRLGDIYGPGRSAVDAAIKRGAMTIGTKMELPRDYISLIHVKDFYQALEASIVKPPDRKVYNIVDDKPVPIEEVVSYAEDLVHKRWPSRMRKRIPIVQETSPRGGSRVSNARMKNELGVSLLYPSYVSGLQTIIDQIKGPY